MDWIVVASRTVAHVFRVTKEGNLDLIKEYANPLGRARDREMEYDQPGLSRAKFLGSAPHSLAAEKTPHEDAAEQFARQISKAIILEMKKNEKLNLRIVAEAKFLGRMKTHFNKSQLLKRVQWIKKDLENIPSHKWPSLIGLNPPNKSFEASSRFPLRNG